MALDITADDFDPAEHVRQQKQAAAEQEREEKMAATVKSGGQNQSTGVSDWVTNLPKNLALGAFDAAVNTIKTIGDLAESGQKMGKDIARNARTAPGGDILNLSGDAGTTPQQRREQSVPPPATDEFRDVVAPAVDAFRDEWARGSGTADEVTQGVAQFVVPFLGWSKAIGGLKGASMMGTLGRAAGAESAAAATAISPGANAETEGRAADMFALGRRVEGRLGETLNTLAPDGSALNAYIDYVSDREDDSALEGRFKNVVDSLGVSAAAAGVLKVGATSLKAARKLPGYIAENAGAGPVGPGAQRGRVVLTEDSRTSAQRQADAEIKLSGGDRQKAFEHLRKQALEQQNPTEAERLHEAARLARGERRAQPRNEPMQEMKVVPSAGAGATPGTKPGEGFVLTVDGKPVLEFLDEKDALDAVADVRRMHGVEYEQRAAVDRRGLTDKNFDTVHTFSRVLQSQKDRPVSTHSLLSSLERNLKGDTEQGSFYKELLQRLSAKRLGGMTTVTDESPNSAPGRYIPDSNAIKLHPGAFASPERLLHVFSHEAVHAATFRQMRESPGVYRRMEKLRTAVMKAQHEADEILRAPARAALDKGEPLPPPPKFEPALGLDRYGFKDADEFVAEIESNPEFRAAMKKLTVDGESAWDKYLRTIAGILGLGALAVNPEFQKLMDPKQEEAGA